MENLQKNVSRKSIAASPTTPVVKAEPVVVEKIDPILEKQDTLQKANEENAKIIAENQKIEAKKLAEEQAILTKKVEEEILAAQLKKAEEALSQQSIMQAHIIKKAASTKSKKSDFIENLSNHGPDVDIKGKSTI